MREPTWREVADHRAAVNHELMQDIKKLEAELEKERSRPDYSYEAQEQLAELREALKETEAFLTAAIKACKCL